MGKIFTFNGFPTGCSSFSIFGDNLNMAAEKLAHYEVSNTNKLQYIYILPAISNPLYVNR